jgi:hypothetical protein
MTLTVRRLVFLASTSAHRLPPLLPHTGLRATAALAPPTARGYAPPPHLYTSEKLEGVSRRCCPKPKNSNSIEGPVASTLITATAVGPPPRTQTAPALEQLLTRKRTPRKMKELLGRAVEKRVARSEFLY